MHPPGKMQFLATECLATAKVLYPARPYLARNRAIVAAVDVLLAIPAGPERGNPGSGTWATVRYAYKAGIPRYVYPATEPEVRFLPSGREAVGGKECID